MIAAEDSPLWARSLLERAPLARVAPCAALDQTLAAMSAKRMVVEARTVQKHGVTSACGDKIWRIDVGMASHYGGKPAALEIVGDTVRVLTADATKATEAADASGGTDATSAPQRGQTEKIDAQL